MKSARHIVALLVGVLVMVAPAVLALPESAFAAGYHPSGEWLSLPGLREPGDVAVAGDGEVFVADSLGGRIVVFDSNGEFLREFNGADVPGESLSWPVGISIGPDARLYVADRGSHRVSVFERSGVFVKSWGGSGSGPTQLLGPFDVSHTATGLVVVSDRFNYRVQIFTADGVFVRTLTSVSLESPYAVAVSGNEVFVAETGASQRVRVFRLDTGAFIREWGLFESGGQTSSRYAQLSGLQIDGTKIYVSDGGRNLIERCTFAGSIEATQAGFSQPAGAVFSAGRLYVADRMKHRIARTEASIPSTVTTFAPGPQPTPPYDGPRVVDAGSDGSIYVAETGVSRVRKYDESGGYLLTFEQPDPPMSSPQGILASHDGPNGEIYVSDTGNHRLLVYSPAGSLLATVGSEGTGVGQYRSPKGLARAFAGYIGVVDSGNRRIQLIAPAQEYEPPYTYGVPSAQPPFGSVSNLTSPTALVAEGEVKGLYYVADEGRNQLIAFDSDGVRRSTEDVGGFGQAAGQFFGPRDVDLGYDGTRHFVLVTDTYNDRIQRFNFGSAVQPVTYSTSFGSTGFGRGNLNRPSSSAVLPTGEVVVADTNNNRLVRFGYDSIRPVTTIGGDVATWLSRPAAITLSATDTGSGVKLIEYRVKDPAGVTGPWTTYRAPFSVSFEGTSVVSYRSTDWTDNVENAKNAEVYVDMTPPSGPVVFAGGASSVKPGQIPVTSTVTDGWTMRLGTTVEPGEWTTYTPTGSIDVAGEGYKTLRAEYRDRAQNPYVVTRVIAVDESGPITTITGPPSGVPATGTVMVTVSAVDTYSPVAVRKYRLDGGPETTYTAPFAVTGNASHTVEAWAVDSLGNEGSVTESTFTISELSAGGILRLADGESVVGTTTVPVSTTAKGATEVRMDLGEGLGDWQAISLPWNVEFAAVEGTATLRAEFRDANGIVISLSDDITIDLSPPVTTVRGLPTQGGSRDPIVFTFLATDTYTTADTVKTYYSLNEGPVTLYGNRSVTLDHEGSYALRFWSVDRFGHREADHVREFVYSNADVAGSFSVVSAVVVSKSTFVRSPDIELAVDVADTQEMRFAVDDEPYGDWQPYSTVATLTLPGEGHFRVKGEFKTIFETTGEEGEDPQYDVVERTRAVNVDLTQPRITSSSILLRKFRVKSGVMYADMRLSSRGIDPDAVFGPASGVNRWAWSIGAKRASGAATEDRTTTRDLTSLRKGAHAVTVGLDDKVGNAANPRTGRLRVSSRKAPRVPKTASPGKAFRVTGAVPVAGSPASYQLLVYKRHSSGNWIINRTIYVKPSVSGSLASISRRLSLKRGRYRVVLASRSGLNLNLSTPSAIITVK